MKTSILLLVGIIFLNSCKKNVDPDNPIHPSDEVCVIKTEIKPPAGFEINTIGEIDFNGSVQSFQFVNAQVGFALMRKSVGGYVEVFKTTDGGQSWSNLNIGINQYPIGMAFRDENVGIITIRNVSGAASANYPSQSVLLKTENGGLDWEGITLEAFRGTLYHPQYDDAGNLYANLSLDNQCTLIKSTDQGASWDTLFHSSDLGFELVTFSFKVFQDKLYISAKDGKILVVDTNGQLLKTIALESAPIWDLDILDENNLVAVTSRKVLTTTNAGDTWQTIYNQNARMIGFDSVGNGLMLLGKSSCATDVYQVNDLIAYTDNAGLSWTEAEETTTNLRISYKNSQKIEDGVWYIMIANTLIEIRKK